MTLKQRLDALTQSVCLSDDELAVRRQKRVLVLLPVLLIPVTALMGLVYLLAGQPLAAAIPLFYCGVSIFSLRAFLRNRRIAWMRSTQLAMILVLPTCLMWLMGGIAGGSVMILWSFLAPVMALLLFNEAHAIRWLIGFSLLLLVSVVAEVGSSGLPPMLPAWAQALFYLLNIGLVCAGLYALVASSLAEERHAHTVLLERQAQLEATQVELLGAKSALEAAGLRKDQELDVARAVQKAQTQFISNVSHDLRTPLNAIIGCGHLLENAQLRGDHRDHLETLNNAGQFMLGLINDLLDIAKIESGEFVVAHEPFSLRDAIAAVGNVMSVNARNKWIDLVVDPLPESLHGFYLGDPLRLRQILFNLLGNAIKFTDKGNVHLSVKHIDATRQGTERLRIEVRDTGCGIAAHNVDDSSMNLKVASRILENAGAVVSTAEDGKKALDWLAGQRNEVDIVLMDVQMPVMDGIAAVMAIRADARLRELPVIAMTAAATATDQKRGIDAGMDAYVSKPFDPITLRTVIRSLVDGYRGADSDRARGRRTIRRGAGDRRIAVTARCAAALLCHHAQECLATRLRRCHCTSIRISLRRFQGKVNGSL